MKSIINELWHGNIIPGEDSRNNSKEMKELLGYMARHHEDLEKTFNEERKEIFEKKPQTTHEEQVFMLQDVATFYQNIRLSCCKMKESMI